MKPDETGPEEIEETNVSEVSGEESPTDNGQVEENSASTELNETTPQQEEPVASVADESSEVVTDDEAEQPQSEDVAEPEAESEEEEAPVEEDPNAIKRGDLIQGTIVETSPLEIKVDLGDDHIGVITSRELDRMGRKILEELQVGKELLVYVVNPNDHEGRTILSVNRAIEEQDWLKAKEYHSNAEVYEGNVAGYNKGGLIVRFGRLRGFVPQSQITDERQRKAKGDSPETRYGPMVNDTIHVKVMEVDRSRNRLILSERVAMREQREARKEELIAQLKVGDVREGTVVSLEDFGAFVDIGGAEGLVHLTEISWQHVTHPRDVLEIGEEVKVEVISVDPKRKRIGLSIKRQLADPWDEVATAYQVGDLVQATVTKLAKFGAFARLLDTDDIEGLVHISELSENRVGHPREVVQEDEKLTLRVVKIDVKNRRLGLSLRRVNSAEYLDRDLKTFAVDAENVVIAPPKEQTEGEADAEDVTEETEAVAAEVAAPQAESPEDVAPVEEAASEEATPDEPVAEEPAPEEAEDASDAEAEAPADETDKADIDEEPGEEPSEEPEEASEEEDE